MDDLKWLIARELPHLRRYARALTGGDADTADDVVQDCLEKALAKRRSWRRSGSVRFWLFRILYRCHIDSLRRRRRRDIADEDVEDVSPAAPPAQDQRIACNDVAEALARLPARQRETILLIALEGVSYDEAAAILDVPVGTVRSRLSRGRDALRHLWSPGLESVHHLRRVK